MSLAANLAVGLVALSHLLFLILEMFLWTRPVGSRVFGLKQDVAMASAPLAANQGLYNGFLAAGLIWGLLAGEGGFSIKVFLLSSVIVAGVFGAFTAKRSILGVEPLPGAVAVVPVLVARS